MDDTESDKYSYSLHKIIILKIINSLSHLKLSLSKFPKQFFYKNKHKEGTSICFIDTIPQEIMTNILCMLDYKDLVSKSQILVN